MQEGAQILRDIAKPLPEELFGTSELSRILKDMEDSLDPYLEGVALAAPQIGVPYRIFIVRKDRTLPPPHEDSQETNSPAPEIEAYINPEIIKTSRKRQRAAEGCLSVHGMYGITERHERVTIRARRPDGSKLERGAGGLMAQIFEHEIDHLNGILFIDHAENVIEVEHAAVA